MANACRPSKPNPGCLNVKFKVGQIKLKVPPMGSLEEACLLDGTITGRRVEVVHIDILLKNRKTFGPSAESRAYPMQVALAMGANEIHLWPTPHKSGEIILKYYPPMITI